ADQAEPLARFEVEADVTEDVDLAWPGSVPDIQVPHRKQSHACSSFVRRTRNVARERGAALRRGLSASSRARPMPLQAITTSVMQRPGGTIAHHAPALIAVRSNAFAIWIPQEGSVGLPRPKNARAASAKIASATVRTVLAINNGARWGRMWRPSTRAWPPPR